MKQKVIGQNFVALQDRFWVREIPLAHTKEGKKFFNPRIVIRVKPGKKVETQWQGV
jgi:hypothetical protein